MRVERIPVAGHVIAVLILLLAGGWWWKSAEPAGSSTTRSPEIEGTTPAVSIDVVRSRLSEQLIQQPLHNGRPTTDEHSTAVLEPGVATTVEFTAGDGVFALEAACMAAGPRFSRAATMSVSLVRGDETMTMIPELLCARYFTPENSELVSHWQDQFAFDPDSLPVQLVMVSHHETAVAVAWRWSDFNSSVPREQWRDSVRQTLQGLNENVVAKRQRLISADKPDRKTVSLSPDRYQVHATCAGNTWLHLSVELGPGGNVMEHQRWCNDGNPEEFLVVPIETDIDVRITMSAAPFGAAEAAWVLLRVPTESG